MALALIGYVLFPTAPPRMLTDLGFIDTLAKTADVNFNTGAVSLLSNPFAAVPSVHTCFSLIIGTTCFFLVRRPAVRVRRNRVRRGDGELLGAGLHHLEIVVARQSRNVVGAGDAHLVFGFGVPRLHFRQRDRPVEQVGARHIAIGASDPELVLVEPQRRAGPVDGRSADRFDDPRRQVGKSLATRQLPDVVRMSVHASCVKLAHSLLMKSWISVRGPASRITTLTPF